MRMIRTRSMVAALALGLLAASEARWPVMGPGIEEGDDDRASLRLVVSVSARRLYVYENGARTRTYRVAVGKQGHSTPRGTYRITRVIWNPWWHPPQREWARGHKPTPPGPNNPMGRVKMYFRDLYYIHGTPHTGSLGQAVSHGCVRMSNKDAVALARLVHKYGSPNVSKATIDKLLANPKMTREIRLTRPVPLQIVTRTAEVVDGRLELFAVDVDASDAVIREEAIEALRGAGFDVERLDDDRLEELVRRSRHAPAGASLAELVAPATGLASLDG